jgi:hypothetical protein
MATISNTPTGPNIMSDLKNQILAISIIQNKNSMYDILKNYIIMFIVETFFNKFNFILSFLKKKIIKEPSEIFICNMHNDDWYSSFNKLKNNKLSNERSDRFNEQLLILYNYNNKIGMLLPDMKVEINSDIYVESRKASEFGESYKIYLCSKNMSQKQLMKMYSELYSEYQEKIKEPCEIYLCSVSFNNWSSTFKNLSLKIESTSIDNSLHILYNFNENISLLIPNNILKISDNIFILSRKESSGSSYSYSGSSVNYEIVLFSDTLKKYELMSWFIEISNNYNKKQNVLYYYSMDIKQHKDYNNKPIIKIYTHKTIMNSNKTFDNLFGSHITFAKDKIDFFIKGKNYYDKLGIPYTLGLLLYGPPGTGKTSFLKAIANYTNKSLITIDLKIAKKSFLNRLFYKGIYKGCDENGYEIKIKDSIIIFEDIDCLGPIVLDRNNKDYEILVNNSIESKNKKDTDENDDYDNIDLNFLLNLFDGVLEIPGRIIIMTSNCPEKLDKALIRDGRIDYKIKFGYCTNKTVQQMYKNFYDKDINFEGFGSEENECNVIPLEINKILCSNINDSEKALEEIEELKQNKKESTQNIF